MKKRIAIPHFTPPARCALAREALDKFKQHRALLLPRAESAKAKPKAGELLIYDIVGESWWSEDGMTPKKVKDWLDKVPEDQEEITVRINSPGGDVFDGVAIYSLLFNSGKRVNVSIDGIAASIASIVAMAGDEIRIVGNGEMMVHKAWTIAMGNADDFAREISALNSIDGNLVATYAARTGQNEADIAEMMGATTWLNPKEALEKGFVDVIDPLKQKPEATDDDAEDDVTIAALATAALLAKQAAEAKKAQENLFRMRANLMRMRTAAA